MLNDGRSIRVAVVGGSRIPFCRSHSVYKDCSNQDLMTAALNGVVNKFDLKGQTIDPMAMGSGSFGAAGLFAELSDKMQSATESVEAR